MSSNPSGRQSGDSTSLERYCTHCRAGETVQRMLDGEGRNTKGGEVPERNTDSDFENFCSQGLNLFLDKNAQYGNSIVDTGVIGAVVECIAKVARLKQLVLRNPEHGRQDTDAVYDSLIDLHNYAVIGLKMLTDNNFDGKDPQ